MIEECIGECSSPKPKYKLGDSVIADGKDCNVVEVFAGSVYHVKNKDEPFDSFVVDLLSKQVGSELVNENKDLLKM